MTSFKKHAEILCHLYDTAPPRNKVTKAFRKAAAQKDPSLELPLIIDNAKRFKTLSDVAWKNIFSEQIFDQNYSGSSNCVGSLTHAMKSKYAFIKQMENSGAIAFKNYSPGAVGGGFNYDAN